MATLKHKDCKECGVTYTPTGPAAKYCLSCSLLKRRACREREKLKRRTGVGSGNSPSNRGVTHPMYKNGIGMYKKIRDGKLKEQDYKCSRCLTDLSEVSAHHKCGHHIDHDRTNNHPDNIEVICKRCHQIEHTCWENFKKGATTIPKGSTT